MKNDIKKGIKNAELDKIKYNVKIFFTIIISIIIGLISNSLIFGIISLLILGVVFARQYYEE